jgi:hypothetical protein
MGRFVWKNADEFESLIPQAVHHLRNETRMREVFILIPGRQPSGDGLERGELV